MDFNQTQAYLGFWVGAVIVTCTQNMITSIISYKARKTHASSILKILFNFSQIVRNIGAFGLYMTPAVASFDQCAASQYLLMIGNNFTRLSLTAFLLWRIRQINIGRNNTDNWICIVLFVTRIAFSVPYFVLQRISTVHNIESDTVICGYTYVNVIPYNTGGIVTEIIIDMYVTHRLVRILKSANKNASRLSPNVKGKRTLFTAVIYWNFLRLIISFVYHFMGIYNMLADEAPDSTLITLSMPIYILLSYVITIDAEIVRAIEGKGQQDGKGQKNEGKSKSKIVKTIQSIDDHISSSLSSNDQTHSQHIYSSLSSSDQTNSQIIDDDKVVVVSMKRLSFFEWANFVIGDEKDEKDENDGNDVNDENDENDENTKNNDRKNNFSNDTLIKTSNKDNVDIIIH